MSIIDTNYKCSSCDAGYNDHHSWLCPNIHQCTCIFENCQYSKINRPERSKREDSQKCEMRCSEHCGNTVRDK